MLKTRHPKIGKTRAFVLWISQETSFPRPHLAHPNSFFFKWLNVLTSQPYLNQYLCLSCVYSLNISRSFLFTARVWERKEKKGRKKRCAYSSFFFLWFDYNPFSPFLLFFFSDSQVIVSLAIQLFFPNLIVPQCKLGRLKNWLNLRIRCGRLWLCLTMKMLMQIHRLLQNALPHFLILLLLAIL